MNNYTGVREELEKEFHRLLTAGGHNNPEFRDFYGRALQAFPNDEDFLYRRLADECFRGEDLLKGGDAEEGRKLLLQAYEHGKELLLQYPDNESAASFTVRILDNLGMKEKIGELCIHSPDEFAALVKKGRGEAVLWLREEKYKVFFYPSIKDATLHDYFYNWQGEYVYSLIKELNDREKQVASICFRWNMQDCNMQDDNIRCFSNFMRLLALLAKDGCTVAAELLRKEYNKLFDSLLNRRTPSEKNQPDCERENYCNASIAAVRGGVLSLDCAVRDIGRLLAENPLYTMFNFDVLFGEFKADSYDFEALSECDDEFIKFVLSEFEKAENENKENDQHFLEKRDRFSDNINLALELIREGKQFEENNAHAIYASIRSVTLEPSQVKELCDIFDASDDIRTNNYLIPLIQVYRVDADLILRKLKKHDHILFVSPCCEMTAEEHMEYSLVNVLLRAIGRIYRGEESIRKYVDELEERGLPPYSRNVIKSQMLAVDDTEEFFKYVEDAEKEAEKDSEEAYLLHSVYFEALSMFETRDDIYPDPELLLRVYDKTDCPECRYKAVYLMEKFNCLPEHIINAARYDSNNMTRKLAESYAGNSNEEKESI